MATETQLELDAVKVEGEHDVCFVYKEAGAHGMVWTTSNTNHYVYGTFPYTPEGKEAALACAREFCDTEGDIIDNDEHDPFNSDAEADADALASAGWGTDEDYGGCPDL